MSKHFQTQMQRLLAGWAPFAAALLYVIATTQVSRLQACPIRWLCGSDCPTCGTTRSFNLILGGNFSQALAMNPISFVVIAALVRYGISCSFPRSYGIDILNSPAIDVLLLTLFFGFGFWHTFMT